MTNRKRGKSANNLTTPIGRHWTITRIVSQPEGRFGFAISDDGRETCYIPRSIIEAHDLSADDEGAGFTAPLKPGTGGGGKHQHVMNPVILDSASDDVSDLAAALEEMGRLRTHLDHIMNKNVEMIAGLQNQNSVLTFMRGEITGKMNCLEDNYPEE